jgi:hypothetical protein
MKYILQGDFEHIHIGIERDPDSDVKRKGATWSHAEFLVDTGIDVPEDIEMWSYESDNPRLVVKKFGEDAVYYDNMAAAPQWFRDLFAIRDKVRMHAEAKYRTGLHYHRGVEYVYDEQADAIVEQDRPDKAHALASQKLSQTKIGCRVIIDLIEVLVAKGIIQPSDLPGYYADQRDTLNQIVTDINWENA